MNPLCAVVLLSVIYFTAPAHSIKCYTCSGPGCQDPFTPVGTASIEVDCTPELARRGIGAFKEAIGGIASAIGFNTQNIDAGDVRIVCAKVDSKDEQSNARVTRSCAVHSEKAGFCETAKKAVGESFVGCSICEGDLCNGATVTHVSLGLMAATIVVLMSFLR